MAIDEQVRHDLFTGLQVAVGVEPAKLMMTAIPPFSWNEIATKTDLAQFATRDEMHTEFTAVRHEMKLESAAVRLEFAAVRDEMHADSAAIRGEMHAGFAAIRLEIKDVSNTVLAQITKIQRNLFFQIIGFYISTAGIVIAALHYSS